MISKYDKEKGFLCDIIVIRVFKNQDLQKQKRVHYKTLYENRNQLSNFVYIYERK